MPSPITLESTQETAARKKRHESEFKEFLKRIEGGTATDEDLIMLNNIIEGILYNLFRDEKEIIVCNRREQLLALTRGKKTSDDLQDTDLANLATNAHTAQSANLMIFDYFYKPEESEEKESQSFIPIPVVLDLKNNSFSFVLKTPIQGHPSPDQVKESLQNLFAGSQALKKFESGHHDHYTTEKNGNPLMAIAEIIEGQKGFFGRRLSTTTPYAKIEDLALEEFSWSKEHTPSTSASEAKAEPLLSTEQQVHLVA